MKKRITFFILVLVVLIGFVSCDTLSRYTVRVAVDRHPVLIILNQTGLPVVITAPVTENLAPEGRAHFQPNNPNQSINVTYRIGGVSFTEQATMNNADAIVTLTRRPPTLTVVNQTGRPVRVTAPVTGNISAGASHPFLAPVMNQAVDVTYTIGQMTFTERVNIIDQNVSVTLTRRPPVVTIVNNTNQIFSIGQIQNAGAADNWHIFLGTGSTVEGGTANLAPGSRRPFPLDLLPVSGERFDFMFVPLGGATPIMRRNVAVTGDTVLTIN